MADYQDRMKDYVPVNERIAAFIEAHPEGSLQTEIVELTETRVTVKAYAYRSPDDPRPGTGHSSLNIPGSTPYTKGSEIENAETSAWGRAIAALGFEVKRGIASTEEVANKTTNAPSLDQIKARLLERADEHHIDTATLDELIRERVGTGSADEVRAGMIALGTAISRGDFDAEAQILVAAESEPHGPSGALTGPVTDGLPPLPENMPADKALAAGLALVGKDTK